MEKLDTGSQIAIIGMAGRFPKANNVNQLWQNLLDNIDSLELLEIDELKKLGIPESTIKRKGYVAAARVLADIEYFDYTFFGLSRKEAELMDPQIRLLMQCAFNTFEDARINLQQQDSVTGVYVGIGANRYLLDNILPNKEVISSVGTQMIQLVNDRDFAATQLAYRLNLTGPAVNISTACSTSLVAVHNAVQALLAYECDMALAGGASVSPIQRVGYQYQQGSIASPDGRCRPFDIDAQGTCYGSGVATVLLKRFDEAKADGDKIYAVIISSAINNDGAEKIGFTAPSIKGQSRVISDAIELAEIDASNISYIEAHGTATRLGDPIEFEALSQAFTRVKNNSCGIGSIKSNLGHLDTASGITGLIKTSMSVYHGKIPASLHFKEPNPEIDLENSPFYIVDTLKNWPSPRIAGISSFGMGGTNAHVIIAEAKIESNIDNILPAHSNNQSDWYLLPLSANDSDVLEQLWASYTESFQNTSDRLKDISWSMFHTRKTMSIRSFIVVDSLLGASDLMTQTPPSFNAIKEPKNIVFMFPGQGSQQLAMAAQLSKQFPSYQQALEQALMELHEETLVRAYLFEENQQCETSLLQPALFCHEYALAKLWQALGVLPTHLIGHSLGEYVAACIGGVFSLSDAIKFVEIRAKLMTKMSPGTMLAIRASQSEIEIYTDSEIELAAVNGPKSCVLAGPDDAITLLQERLEQNGISSQRLQTSHAFHSAAVEPLLHSFRNAIASLVFNPPKIPIISNLTGTWLTPQQATDPEYWCQHMRNPVLYNKGTQTLLNEKIDCYIEVGPGKALSHFTLAAGATPETVISGISGQEMASPNLLDAIGRFWMIGGNIDTEMLYTKIIKPVDLPLYPFKKDRVWLSHQKSKNHIVINDIFKSPKIYQTIWQSHQIIDKKTKEQEHNWLFFADNQLFAKSLAQKLCLNTENITIIPFHRFATNNGRITAESVHAVWFEFIAPLFEQNKPYHIINCWPLDYSEYSENRDSLFDVIGYFGQILSSELYQVPITFTTLTDRALSIYDTGCDNPIQSLAHSMPIVMQQEINGLYGQIIDIDLTKSNTSTLQTLSSELSRKERIPIRILRNHLSWQPRFIELLQNSHAKDESWINSAGHYLITGGLGQLGLTLSHWLAKQSIKALTLVTRSPFPDQSQWQKLVDQGGTDQTLKAKLKKLLDIKKKNVQLTVLDTAWHTEQIIRDSINEAERISGPINGIFHSAAHFDKHTLQPLKQFNLQNADRQFKTKVEATYALHKTLKQKKVDFVVLMSSLSAILAGPGHCIYSAANKFLDVLAKQSHSETTQWLSIAWDGWNVSAEPGKGSITEDDAPKLFESLFWSHGNTNLAVACQELEPRFNNWVRQVHPQIESSTNLTTQAFEKSDIQHILEKCWQDIIGIEKSAVDANFFALGGDSLAAIRLTGLIQQRMNISITVPELYANSNFQDMVELLISHKKNTLDSILVPLREGQGEPILLIHPGGGGIAIYQSLLEHLKLNNPFYGIRARGVDAGSESRLFDDMKHLAYEYTRELATEFEGSSIILVGYCFGGLIANELAQEFEKHNISVSKVILLDSTHPRIRPSIENSFAFHLNEMFGDLPDVSSTRLASFDEAGMTNHIAKQALKSGKFPEEVSQQQAENYIRLAENHLKLELNYRPEPFTKMVLLRAEDETSFRDKSDSLGWYDVQIFDVPGDHKTMIKSPHVTVLAQQITDLIKSKDQ